MAVFRIQKNKENPYVMLNKEFLNDETLSWKAKGMLAYLLSLPDDWKIYEEEIATHSKDGIKATRSGIKELITSGYIHREQLRENGKFKGYGYCVYESPTVMPKQENGDNITVMPKSENGKSKNGKQENRKRHTTNNDSTNIDLSNNKLVVDVEVEKNNEDELINFFEENICELKPTTKIQFKKYIATYDNSFIKSLITYCTELGKNSFAGFKVAIESFISKDATTTERMVQEIRKYRESRLKPKKQYSKSKKQTDTFNDFEQREYDFDSLEKKLLGWV